MEERFSCGQNDDSFRSAVPATPELETTHVIRHCIAAVLTGFLATASTAQTAPAADWPARPLRLVVPYAPGGTSDTLGRLVAQHLQTALKQNVLVDNKGGGGGTIGSLQVAKAAPDGYTLVVSGIGSHVIAPVEIGSFNPMTDFTHIAMLGGPPLVLAVHPSLGVSSLRELIAYAQRTKGGYSWGSPGQGTHGHLIGELLAQRANIPHTHLAYKGAAPALQDLVAGQIPVTLTTYTSANAFIKSGQIKALALSSPRRLAELPDVPTFAELGYPDMVATTWFAISGPAGMPAAVVDKLNAEIRRGLKTPAARRQLAFESIQVEDLEAPAVNRFFRAELDRWVPLAQSVVRAKKTP